MTQSRTELIDIVGRILAGPEYWDDPRYHNDPNKDAYEVGELAKEIVTALRPEVTDLPPCGHDTCFDYRCTKVSR